MFFLFSNLITLPISLSSVILNHWLTICELAKLDSACCNFCWRPIFLRMLSSRQFIQRKKINVSRAKEFAWLIRKNMGVYTMIIDGKLQMSEEIFNYLEVWGNDVRGINFYSASGDLFLIAMHCRNLVSVAFSGSCVGHHFRDILCCNPTLETVLFECFPIVPYLLRNITLPNLKTLYFTEMQRVAKDFSEGLSRISDSVTRLCLSNMDFSSADIIPILPVRYKELRTLDLSSTIVDDAGIDAITQACAHIVNLQLRRCDEINDTSVLSIAKNLHELRTLDIRGCYYLTNDSITHLIDHSAARLVELYINIDFAFENTLAELFRMSVNLQTLALEMADDTTYPVETDLNDFFQAMSHIPRLHLHGLGLIQDHLLALVGRYCTNLIYLRLEPVDDHWNSANVEDKYFSERGLVALLIGCTKLQMLAVYDESSLLQNKLAIAMWQAIRPGLVITRCENMDYDAMKCDL